MNFALLKAMNRYLTVSKWYTLLATLLILPSMALAQAPQGQVTVTGLAPIDAQAPAQTPNGAAAPEVLPPRMLPVDPNVSYPNISKELTDEAADKDPNNAEAAGQAQQFLQSLMNFGQGDYQRPAQSGWTAPDASGSQSYKYNPEPGYENAPAVDNNFPKTCDKNVQAIPLNPSGVSAASLAGHKCSPYDDRLTCMVCNLFHEAPREAAVGQLAVAQNVMTRVFNGKYPDTVCKTVWEHKQYSWTWLYKGDRLKLSHNTAQIQHLIDVAKEGMCLGPNGYTNYYNPQAANPNWGGGQCERTKKVIGNHKFCTIGNGRQTRSVAQVRAAEGFKHGEVFRAPASTTPGIK